MGFTNRRIVQQLRDVGIIPEPSTSTLDEIRDSYIGHLREVAAGRIKPDDGNGNLDLNAEKARLAKESADEKALKNGELRGELIPASDVESWLVSLLSGVRSRLLGVPLKAAPLAYAANNPQEAQDVIERLQTEALQEVSDALAGDRPSAPVTT